MVSFTVANEGGLSRFGVEHDPEKWVPVFPKRSCSNKKIERDDDSKKSHPALVHLKASQPHSISGGLVPRSRCNGIYDRRFDEHKNHRLAALRTDSRRGFLGIGRSRGIRGGHDQTLRHRTLPGTGGAISGGYRAWPHAYAPRTQ